MSDIIPYSLPLALATAASYLVPWVWGCQVHSCPCTIFLLPRTFSLQISTCSFPYLLVACLKSPLLHNAHPDHPIEHCNLPPPTTPTQPTQCWVLSLFSFYSPDHLTTQCTFTEFQTPSDVNHTIMLVGHTKLGHAFHCTS